MFGLVPKPIKENHDNCGKEYEISVYGYWVSDDDLESRYYKYEDSYGFGQKKESFNV